MLDIGWWILDGGWWILDVGYWMLDSKAAACAAALFIIFELTYLTPLTYLTELPQSTKPPPIQPLFFCLCCVS